jgi:hypothetical protein
MPYEQQTGLPFAAQSHTSYRGALAGAVNRAGKTRRYLQLLMRGPVTDWEAHQALGIERSTVNSIRAGLMKAWLVTKGDETRPGPDGVTPNQTWRLTHAGQAAVAAMTGDGA